MKQYSHEQKKQLAERISKIKKKEVLIKVGEIIKNDNQSITENSNGLFIFFNKISDSACQQIETLLNDTKKVRSSNDSSSELDYTTYSQSEFTDSEAKYSNKEKNLIKKQRHGEYLEKEQNDS